MGLFSIIPLSLFINYICGKNCQSVFKSISPLEVINTKSTLKCTKLIESIDKYISKTNNENIGITEIDNPHIVLEYKLKRVVSHQQTIP